MNRLGGQELKWARALAVLADRWGFPVVTHADYDLGRLDHVLSWAKRLSDDDLVHARNFGPKGAAWLRDLPIESMAMPDALRAVDV